MKDEPGLRNADCRLRGLLLETVVAGIEASVVSGLVDREPVGCFDAAAVEGCDPAGKRGRDFQPAVLFMSDNAEFSCHFGKVLILAEDHGHVVFLAVGHADDVDGTPHIDALLLGGEKCVFLAARRLDAAVSVSQATGEHRNALTTHRGHLRNPEVTPGSVILRRGHAGVEAHLSQFPAPAGTDGLRQRFHVVVGIGVGEGLPRGMV